MTFHSAPPRPGRAYLLAVLLPLVLGGVKLALDRWLGSPWTEQALLLLGPAVLLSALYGGLGPGLVTTGICLGFAGLQLGQRHGLGGRVLAPLLLYGGQLVFSALVCAALRADRRRAAALVQERTESEARLQAQAAQLAAANRLKDQFLAVLAHELRGPLNPILLSLGMLKRPGRETDLLALVKFRDMVDRQAAHMMRLVEDLSEVSRIAAGKLRLRLQPLDLTALLAEIVVDHQKVIEGSGVTLTARLPDGPLWVEGDATRLTQVFLNLLTNAAKFTPPGGRIQLTATPRAAAGLVVVAVADTGMGIEPALQPQVFEMFTQIHRATEAGRRGLGLGLHVVQRLIQLHGGTVQVYSPGLGQGATFTCLLPLSGATMGSPAPAPSEEHDGSNRNPHPGRAADGAAVV